MNQHDGATAIAWRDWNEEAFLAARAEGKPVLLTWGPPGATGATSWTRLPTPTGG